MRYSVKSRWNIQPSAESLVVTNQDTDRLIKLAQKGDESAFQQLLIHHRARLKRMVLSVLNPRLSARIDPSDVVQDAMVIAARKLPDYLQKQPVAFYPWLRQIVKEMLIDVHRRHVVAERRSVNREYRLDFQFPDESVISLAQHWISPEPSPSKISHKREMIQQVRNGLERMSSDDRELLLMRFNEQLGIRDISEVLGVSELTARSRMRLAIERLGRLVIGEGLGE